MTKKKTKNRYIEYLENEVTALEQELQEVTESCEFFRKLYADAQTMLSTAKSASLAVDLAGYGRPTTSFARYEHIPSRDGCWSAL